MACKEGKHVDWYRLKDKIEHGADFVITQLFFHSSLLKSWGANKLGAYHHDEWFDKMRRFDTVLDRILELGGRPASRDSATLRIGHDVREVLRSDIDLEETLISDLREASSRCERIGDRKTGDLLEGILNAELKYADWLRAQLYLIELGLEPVGVSLIALEGAAEHFPGLLIVV